MSPSFSVREVFRQEMDLAVQQEIDQSGFAVPEWFWAGPYDGHKSIDRWYDQGPEMVEAFIGWWEFNPEAEIWITPDGTPAIELPFEITLGSVPVRGFIDLVVQIGTALVVVDLKTSAKTPGDYRQLALYACALELSYGIRPRYGTFFMCRGIGRGDKPKTYFMRPVELDKPQFSVEYLTREFALAEKAIQEGIFPAKPGEQCARCGVAYACTEADGHKAKQLDPNWPEAKNA